MKKANRQLNEELIRKVEAAYDHAWQMGDVEGIVACFAKDGIIMSPRGDVAYGHKEIRDILGENIPAVFPRRKKTGDRR